MELIKALKFVRGAVAKSTAIVDMKHFAIEAGHVRATNGVLTLGCPIDVDLSAAPEAARMYRAIDNCKDVVSLIVTPTNRLSVRSGKFSALVPCLELRDMPHPKPSGHRVDMAGQPVYDAFDALHKFVSKDDLRPWTNGVLLSEQSAFATNNACLAQYWMGVEMPFALNVPLPAIKEVLRAGVPETILADAQSVTFMYGDGRWIKSLLYETSWPPLGKILDVQCNPQPIPDDLFDGLAAVDGFNDSESRLVYFSDGQVWAKDNSDSRASYDVAGLHHEGAYRAEMLALLKGVATSADFSRYPDHAIFYGDRIRGALMAYRP